MDALSGPAIEIEGLTKRFPRTEGYKDILTFWRRQYLLVLDNVSLRVPRGTVFGLLGPNGAGKTTLMKTLSGLVLPDAGRITVNGVDSSRSPQQIKSSLTYISGEERSLFWRLTGRENLEFFAAMNQVPGKQSPKRIEDLLAVVSLTEAADTRVERYSSGMKQRLSIARGLLSDPEILLLDEPTRSLDPLATRRMWTFIQEDLMDRHGHTIMLATHNMEEASSLCDQVAIMHLGRVQVCDTVATLTNRMVRVTRYAVVVSKASQGCIKQLDDLPGIGNIVVSSNGDCELSLEVTIAEPDAHISVLLEHLIRGGARILEVNRVQPSLSDAITAMTEESQ